MLMAFPFDFRSGLDGFGQAVCSVARFPLLVPVAGQHGFGGAAAERVAGEFGEAGGLLGVGFCCSTGETDGSSTPFGCTHARPRLGRRVVGVGFVIHVRVGVLALMDRLRAFTAGLPLGQ